MKIKEIEKIVTENIQNREQEIGRDFTEKEKAIAVLVEQLKVMAFDPNFFFHTKSEGKMHQEFKERLKSNSKGEKVTIEDVGEMDISPEATCKMLAMVYKYIADKNGLNVILEGVERGFGTYQYSEYFQLYATGIEEHLYAIVKLKSGEEVKIDVQDEAKALKTKRRPRNLGARISSEYMFTQEDEEIDKIMRTVGYLKEGEKYSDDYAHKLVKDLNATDKSEYEKMQEFMDDPEIKKALEKAGVVASYEFYEKFLVKLSNSHFDGTDKIFLLPCYLTRVNSQGEEKVSHSYIIYYSDTDVNDIFLYSNQKGAVERIEPELMKKFLETNLHIGYKDLKTMMRPKSEFGKKKLEQYINGKTKTDGISLDD